MALFVDRHFDIAKERYRETHPILAEALAQRLKSDAVQICLNSDEKPWKTGFNASWALSIRSFDASLADREPAAADAFLPA
ncbi:MAG: hypothetical protein ABSF67_19350 [Roseiarcus sp.]